MEVLNNTGGIELVKVDEVTARLDLYPPQLTRTVLGTLGISPVYINGDDKEWYFWKDVIESLIAVATQENT